MSLVNQSIIKHKMGLLNLAEELQNVSQACRVMGVSRDTFYRVKEAKESGGMEALLHKDRRRANLKNRLDTDTEHAILAFSVENPSAGHVRVTHQGKMCCGRTPIETFEDGKRICRENSLCLN